MVDMCAVGGGGGGGAQLVLGALAFPGTVGCAFAVVHDGGFSNKRHVDMAIEGQGATPTTRYQVHTVYLTQ